MNPGMEIGSTGGPELDPGWIRYCAAGPHRGWGIRSLGGAGLLAQWPAGNRSEASSLRPEAPSLASRLWTWFLTVLS